MRFRVRRLLALANARVFAVDRFSKSRADGRCNPPARAKMHRVCEGQIEVLRLTGQKPNQARYPLRLDRALRDLNLPRARGLTHPEALSTFCGAVDSVRCAIVSLARGLGPLASLEGSISEARNAGRSAPTGCHWKMARGNAGT